jgi:eukaryotic-like serine/threonine-protein kinase
MSSASADSEPEGEFYCPTCEQAFANGGACPIDGHKLIRLGGTFDPFLGRELEGKYTIVEKLGQGGMGAVYRAEQRGLGRDVAIKVIHAQRISDPEVIKRFLREAKLASRLGHPNAVGVIDFGQTDDGVCYLVMELVTGRTLDQVLASDGVLPPERLVRIGTQICDALECAHALQIVHRDLKPANAMLLDQGRDFVKILDFGLAKSVGATEATPMTITGTALGTPAYMSPEVALGRPCDGRADLYSLGVVLYLLGTGRLPFTSNSPHELIAMHSSEPAPPMLGVPRELAEVVERLLRKDPAERYQTAAAVREALERALVGGGAAGADTGGGAGGAAAAPAAAPADSSEARASTLPAPGLRVPRGRRTRRWLAPVVIGSLAAAGVAAYLARAGGSRPSSSGSPLSSPAAADAGEVDAPPPDAAPVAADAALEAAMPPAGDDAGATSPAKPARPRPTAPPPNPARTRPRPPRPAAPATPKPATKPAPKLAPTAAPKPARAGSASGGRLPF